MRSRERVVVWWFMVVALLSLSRPLVGVAQTGTVIGVIRSKGEGVPRAHVDALVAEASRGVAQSDEKGSYRLALPPGEYTILVRLPGYAPRRVDGVRVTAGSSTTVDAELTAQPFELNKIVVSAARHSEKVLDVVSSVSVVDETTIQERTTTSPLDYVLTTPGVDIAVQGLESRQMVGRGFSGTFNPSLLMLSDYRNAAIPSTRASLSYFLTPNSDDLDRVEVVRGPASALYGPNAADGVVHFITKSPFDSPGTTLSFAGGGRSVVEGTGRYAAVVNDRLAFKISGTYFRGREWLAPPQQSEIIPRDPIAERANGELRADYRVSSTGTAVLTLGSSSALRNVEYSPIATFQLDHSRADFAQLRYSDGAFFAQVYTNNAVSPAGSTVNLQTKQTTVDYSNTIVAQAQHGFNVGERTNVIYGVDFQRTNPVTAGTVFGRNENDDSSIETGVYSQASVNVTSRLQLVGAARVDEHSRINGAVFSPRLAAVFTPKTGQRFRLSYNRAFSTLTPGQLSLDVVAATLNPLPFTIRALGVPKDGFQFARDCGGICMASPFAPGQKMPADATLMWPAVVQIMKAAGVDLSPIPAPKSADVSTALRSLDLRNGTFVTASSAPSDIAPLKPTITNELEAGYKGLLGDRFVFDGSVYYTRRKNFVAPLAVATPNVFFNTASLATYLARFMPAQQAGAIAAGIGGVDGNAQAPGIPVGTVGPSGPLGGSDILLTYHNVGDVRLWGADLSGEYAPTDYLSLSGSYSWLSDNFFAAKTPSETDLSTNTPKNKALLGARVRERSHDASLEVRGRYVDGFHMVDGIWNGYVRAFTVADVEASAAVPGASQARLTVTVQNATNARHSEFLAAPILGRLVLMRLQYRL